MSALPSLAKAAPKRSPGPYEQLGIRPVVNFQGTMTTLGASKMWEELHEAAAQASREYVVLEELKEKIGKRLSTLIGCEDAMVTPGAAAAISLGTCASLTGSDTQKARQLPDLTGMKKEVIIQKVHRNGYDHAVRNTGVRIVDVASERALIDAIGDQTAMMYFLGGTSGDWRWETPVSLERCLEITRRAGVPLMVDAANMLPPWDNIRRLAGLGVDLICISGGKHMRGPQCSGILAGRRDLIQSAWLNSSPHSDSLGRPMKVGREEMVTAWLTVGKVLAAGLRCHRSPVRQTGRVHRTGTLGRAWSEAGAHASRQDTQDPPRDGALGRTGLGDHRRRRGTSAHGGRAAHCGRTSAASGDRVDGIHERSGRRKDSRQAAEGNFQGLIR